MTFVGSFQIDPKDYPFKKFLDEQAHLDTDELRQTIKSVHHHIETDFKGKEHKYCDKSQLDAEGKFRRPKKLQEAERRGFKTVMDMIEADKKVDDATLAEKDKQISLLTEQVQTLTKLCNERFDKVASLLQTVLPK